MSRSRNLGMRVLGFVLCLACFLSLGQSVAATETAKQSVADAVVETATTQAQSVAATKSLTTLVRLKGNSKSTVIGRMENGTLVKVLKKKGSYYKVDCYGMKGYIAKTQLTQGEDGKYYVSCDPDSPETRKLTYTDHANALSLRQSLVALGKKNLGYRYRYGGTRPGGFDCSGLMLYLYSKHGITLHRTAAAQLQDGIVVPRDGLQVGDLIFFYERGRHYPASHVGIYIGNNKMIHSGSRGTEIADLSVDYYVKYYIGARRVINTGAVQMETAAPVGAAGGLLPMSSISGRTAK